LKQGGTITSMKKKKGWKRLNPLFFDGIAHRGLHNSEFTENGLKAFQNAIAHGLAFELDVHLTKDNDLLVCHDSELLRTTGKKGIIEELPSSEIRSSYRLLDGEVVPSFQEVLDLDHEQSPIVVELKVYNDNYKALAKRTLQALKQIKDRRNIWIISFDPRALLFMGHHFMRSLLVCEGKEWTYKYRGFFESIDIEDSLVQRAWATSFSRRHFVNVWTIDSVEKFDKVFPYVDTVTFQSMDEKYVQEQLKNK
jgi:glycerophosphoryl diester phosphodiesterase